MLSPQMVIQDCNLCYTVYFRFVLQSVGSMWSRRKRNDQLLHPLELFYCNFCLYIVSFPNSTFWQEWYSLFWNFYKSCYYFPYMCLYIINWSTIIKFSYTSYVLINESLMYKDVGYEIRTLLAEINMFSHFKLIIPLFFTKNLAFIRISLSVQLVS